MRRKHRKPAGARSGPTVAIAVEEWLATRIATGRNVHNQRQARARARIYLLAFMGDLPLREVTPNHLRQYRLWLEGRPGVHGRSRLASRTVAWILGDAKNFLFWAEESGLVARAPVPRRLLPRLQELPPDHLNDTQVSKVLEIPEPHAFIVRLALGTGMRWSEICRCHAEDLEDGMLTVHRTKSGRIRRIPLDHDPKVRAEIESRSGRLCPRSETGSGTFAKFVRRHSGVITFRFHQLRHTFAVHWLRRGGTLAVLQEILGHSTVVMTQRYAKLTEAHVRSEAKRLALMEGEDRWLP